MDLTSHAQGHYLSAATLYALFMRPSGIPKDGDMEFTVEEVVTESVYNPGNGRNEELPVCYFEGVKPGLVLSRAVCQSMIEAMGASESNEWTGRRVLLYVAKCGRGDSKTGIRAKPSPNSHPAEAETARKASLPLGPDGERTILEKLLRYETPQGVVLKPQMFVEFVKANDRPMYEAIWGKSLDDWPRSTVAAMGLWITAIGARERASAPAPRPPARQDPGPPPSGPGASRGAP